MFWFRVNVLNSLYLIVANEFVIGEHALGSV